MDKAEVKITPQDIIEKEFRVKFRGFDMAEVDTFLEEVAETFFQLTEENTLLNEKVFSLQQELENVGSLSPQGMAELPVELGNILEDLRQDTASISADIVALKQDRQTFDAIKTKLEKVIVAVQEAVKTKTSGSQQEFPADLADRLKEFANTSTDIAAELDALKENRLALDAIRTSFGEIIHSARDAGPSAAHQQGSGGIPADLQKALEDFKQGRNAFGTELAALKQEVQNASAVLRTEIKKDLQDQLSEHLKAIGSKFSPVSHRDQPPAAPDKKETLLAAEIREEPAGQKKETTLPDYRKDTGSSAESDLEFLSEDDILDVDKLRGIFQSVLDEEPDEGHVSREGDEAVADLLFLEEELFGDGPEPEVTFSLEEDDTDRKEGFRKK